MERLTKRLGNKGTVVFTQGKYEETIPAEMTVNETRIVLRKLADYEDLEEQQGFLIKLPCRPDDSVFIIVGKDISRQKIRKVTLESDSILFETRGRKFGVGCFGDTVFTDRESAERRLKELWED